jgi:hypothetical protein
MFREGYPNPDNDLFYDDDSRSESFRRRADERIIAVCWRRAGDPYHPPAPSIACPAHGNAAGAFNTRSPTQHAVQPTPLARARAGRDFGRKLRRSLAISKVGVIIAIYAILPPFDGEHPQFAGAVPCRYSSRFRRLPAGRLTGDVGPLYAVWGNNLDILTIMKSIEASCKCGSNESGSHNMSKEHISSFLEQLRLFFIEQNLLLQAIDKCDIALQICEQEEIELNIQPLKGWIREDIHKRLRQHTLVLMDKYPSSPYIETVLDLYIPSTNKKDTPSAFDMPIGFYKLITNLDGVIEDDYLVIEQEAE